VGRLVDRSVRPGADDPLIALFERTVAEAQEAGLTEADIEAELAAYDVEAPELSAYVFDANTVVSAALNLSGYRGTLTLSDAVYLEIAEVLARPKFAAVLTEDRCREALELLSAAALWVDPAAQVRDCRDSKDNRCLELAVAAGATAIVSGNADLLAPYPWRGVQLLRPAEFLQVPDVAGWP
jgi:uncharacterized protein